LCHKRELYFDAGNLKPQSSQRTAAEDAEHGAGISAQRLAAAFLRVDYILGFLLGDDMQTH